MATNSDVVAVRRQSDGLVGVVEIARLIGLSRQRADQLSREVGFPAPAARLAMGRIWWRNDVMTWDKRRRMVQSDDR